MSGSTKSVDKVTVELLGHAAQAGIEVAWDRLASQLPQCGYGTLGLCCRHCAMGPCNVDPFGEKPRLGVCGVDGDTMAARHFGRMIAAGTASHSDHARGVAEMFLAAAKGEVQGYEIKDIQKLFQVAMDLGIEVGKRDVKDIAIDVGEKALAVFGNQEGEIPFVNRAPLKRQAIWRETGVVPRGVDREVVEMMHRTHMGVDQDPVNLIMHGTRAALADGWGGSMVATELQDIMFGTPVPLHSQVNLGVLDPDSVNIVVHGHEPLLSEMVVAAAQSQEMIDYARSKGAKGINLAGICCTANEVLMRHGIPLAGNFLQQELALVTGAVEMMIVDVQCIMQSLPEVASCFHTEVVTTNERAKVPGAVHVPFDEHKALESGKALVKRAIESFPRRNKDKVRLPSTQGRVDLIAGFSHETINYLLGGIFRASYRPLNDNIINGRIRGIAGVVGCNNPKVNHDDNHLTLVRELIKNDVIVLQTGCSAMACAKEGLLTPEAARHAGPGLAEVCETVGIPPVLHMGSCVDNSRILMAATAVVKEGGLGDDISDLPAAGAAPEWMSEKAIAIGQYFVGSGAFVVFGTTFPTLGAKKTTDYLFNGIEKTFGGKWAFEPNPNRMAALMIDHMNRKRAALGIDKAKERVLYDMAMRRELEG